MLNVEAVGVDLSGAAPRVWLRSKSTGRGYLLQPAPAGRETAGRWEWIGGPYRPEDGLESPLPMRGLASTPIAAVCSQAVNQARATMRRGARASLRGDA